MTTTRRRIPAVLAAIAALAAAGAIAGTRAAAADGARAAWCSNAESFASAKSHVGRSVRVKARVAGALWARTSNGQPTFLDLGYAYPDSRRLTVLIWGEDRANFPVAPERMFRAGTLVCVQGLVTRYRGVAQIEVGAWDRRARVLRP